MSNNIPSVAIPAEIFDYATKIWSVGALVGGGAMAVKGEWMVSELMIKNAPAANDATRFLTNLAGSFAMMIGGVTYNVDMNNDLKRRLYGMGHLIISALAARTWKKHQVASQVLTVLHGVTGALCLVCKPKAKTA